LAEYNFKKSCNGASERTNRIGSVNDRECFKLITTLRLISLVLINENSCARTVYAQNKNNIRKNA